MNNRKSLWLIFGSLQSVACISLMLAGIASPIEVLTVPYAHAEDVRQDRHGFAAGARSQDDRRASSARCELATGRFDPEAAASNMITTCRVLDTLDLVEQGRIIRLGRDYDADMPVLITRTFEFEQRMPDMPETDDPQPSVGPFGENRFIANEGQLFSQIDQVGTQFDGPGHVGQAEGDDPRFGHYYLGLPVSEVNATPDDPEGGLRRLGVEHVKPLVTRGILVDLAPLGTSSCAGEPCWDAGEEIELTDVRNALRRQERRLQDIRPGDAVFFNTGWGNLWTTDNERFYAGEPGIGLEMANWLARRKVLLVGSDNWGVEVFPRQDGLILPVHQRLIVGDGIFLHEALTFDELIRTEVYEFAYIYMPVPIKGATGSPGSPLALY